MDDCFNDRYELACQRIEAACARSNRSPDSVSILPVAKTFGPDAVTEAAASGVMVIGENRVQEAKQKKPLCPGHLGWHMIGHLQRNKVRDAVRLFDMIHSVDSQRLLEELERACGDAGKSMPVCLQVNVSGEGSKYGMAPDDLPSVLDACQGLVHVDVCGLMTIPPFSAESEDSRPYLRQLRELRDECRERSGFELSELSMGMSNDFEIAVEEGSTWIRLGRELFGDRPRAKKTGEIEFDL